MNKIKEIIDSLEGKELCRYCKYTDDCTGDVIGGPNGPVYPPCADGLLDDDFDIEAYENDLEDDNET